MRNTRDEVLRRLTDVMQAEAEQMRVEAAAHPADDQPLSNTGDSEEVDFGTDIEDMNPEQFFFYLKNR